MIQLATDSDSLVYKALHRRKDEESLEWMYAEFMKEILNIEYAVKREVGSHEKINHFVVFSPAKSFRNRLTDKYKANRPEHDKRIAKLKRLITERLGEKVLVDKEVEADDIITELSSQGFLTSAIDKDILEVTKSMAYDFNKRVWHYEKSDEEIEDWYIYQSLMGDSADGIKGVHGYGKEKAKRFVENIHKEGYDAEDWVELFESEEQAVETMRLIRMDQWSMETGLTLWNKEDWIYG